MKYKCVANLRQDTGKNVEYARVTGNAIDVLDLVTCVLRLDAAMAVRPMIAVRPEGDPMTGRIVDITITTIE